MAVKPPFPEEQPVLGSERLILRPFRLQDAPRVEELAGDRAIADTTLNIPHPYPPGAAREWIKGHAPSYRKGEGVIYAVVLRPSGELIGAVGLGLELRFNRAELGYWIGKPYWGQGYATEAAALLLDFGFRTLGLQRIMATHLTRNPASGRVMQKLGMTYEGCLRQHVIKWGIYEDVAVYGILRHEYLERQGAREQGS